MSRLDAAAVARVSGPAWQPLKQLFLDISDLLLSVSETSESELTTIYVKYQERVAAELNVFAVVWLKSSKQIVVGLALPEAFDSDSLGPAPAGMSYRGITKYLTLRPGDLLPPELRSWITAAYQSVIGRSA